MTLVKNKGTNENIVLKVIRPNLDTIKRIKREIRTVKILNHDHIPKIVNTHIDNITNSNEIIWILEEYIKGHSLRDVLNTKKIFALNEIIKFFDTMLSILQKSESNNIIHRDIKPENIMIDSNDEFGLIDFGISRHLDLESLTTTNSPFGPCTLGYAASEQFRNRKKDIDIRADLFSLGVVAAEMIIGYNFYLQNTFDIIQLIKNIENQPLPLLQIKGDSQFLLAKFIKTLGDNRISIRPRSIEETKRIFELVKCTLNL